MSDARAGRTYAGRSPEERRAERRQKLLDAAVELYGTLGYAATSITQLCATAGVAPGKFYEEFAGKEPLLVELCTLTTTAVDRATQAAVAAAPPDLPSRTRAGCAAFFHGLLDDPRVGRVLLIECVGVSTELDGLRREFHRHRARVLLRELSEAQGVDVGPIMGDPTRARLVSLALVGAGIEATTDWLLDPDRPPIDELIDAVTDLYVKVAESYASPASPASPGRRRPRAPR